MPKKTPKKNVKLSAKRTVFRAVKHAIVPHRGNGFHPHAIRRNALTIVLATIVALQLMPQPQTQLTVLGEETDVTSQSLLDDTNTKRADAGVADLEINERLAAAATAKANDMFEKQYWAHTSPDGTTPWFWLREVNYRYSYAGENLGKGFRTAGALVTAWMDSPEHRDNMLNPNYQHVGFAVIEGRLNGETTKLVVAMYGAPVSAGGGTTQTVLGAKGEVSLIARVGMAFQSMTPTMLATILLLLVLTIISLWAHAYRKYLPKPVRKTWKRHHGLYKAIFTACLVLTLIALYGGGQI